MCDTKGCSANVYSAWFTAGDFCSADSLVAAAQPSTAPGAPTADVWILKQVRGWRFCFRVP